MLARSLPKYSARVVCVHVMQNSIPPTVRAFQNRWPEATLKHIMDDSIPHDCVLPNGSIKDKEADARIIIIFTKLQLI